VDVVSGNLHLLTEDLAVDCYGIPFALTRSYNSRPGAGSGQWLFSIEEYALTEYTRTNQSDLNGRGLRIMRSDGSPQDYFLDSSGNYRPINPGNFDLAVETGIGVSRQLRIYEMGGVVRTYVKSPIPVSSNSYSATLWTLKSVKSPRGHGITISHSSTPSHLGYLPRITTVTDAANRTYTISYDSSGRINQVADFSGRQVAYTWDSNNNITSFQDVRGYTTNFSYRTSTPGNKRLLAIQAPRGNFFLQAISYDSSDRVLSLQDGDSYTTSYSYATSSTTVTPPIAQERARYTIDSSTKAITGVIESYGYGDYTTSLSVRSSATADSIANYSLVDGKTDPSNRSTTLGYAANTRGQVQTITGNDGKSAAISYNNLDLSRNLYAPSTITSRAGRSYDMEANGYGEVTRSEDAAGNATTTSYNSYGVPATITDARLNSTTIFYDTSGYPTQITDAVNNSIFITNDALGRPTRVVDRRGSKTDFTYDAAGNVLTISDNLNNQIINEYDANGNLTRTRDRRGNLTVSSYNNRDLPYQIFRNAPVNGAPATIAETNFYDSMGRVIQTTNGRGNSTTQSFTNRGQLSTVTNGAGELVLSLTYNPDGTVATRTTGSGASASTITFGYDSLGRQTSATDSLGNQVRTDYNDDHQVTGTRDARGAWTTMAYDAAARLASVTDANGAISRVYYDPVGNVTQVQDPRGYSTYHTYDPLNRRTQERDELNRIWGYAYDPEGNLLTETFPDGRVFNSTYDTLGRLDYISYGGPRFADFDYDADGNMTTMIDHLGISGFTWDSMNRLQSAHDPYGQTISYLYDAASNRTRITYPGSRIVDYTFDSAERMSTVTPWVGGAFTYSWRPDGKLSQLVNGNGTYTTYGYDTAARLTSMLTRNGGGTTFIAQNFTLDPNGNTTRITGEQPTAPPLGPAKSMTVDSTNRLLTDDGYAVSHDAAGRMTANPSNSGGTATFFGRDWLASYTPNGGSTTSYTYNGFGQRLSRSQGAATTRYLLDQNQSLPAVLAENDASNSPQRFYIHGLGLLASIDTSNNVQTYHANHRGDILALTNSGGTVTESYGYSPYGLTSASNSFSTNPFRFGGALGVMDEGNGLHFMRARYYNANLGRFLSMDQFPGGLDNPQSLDRFAYALGNPISNVDPSGLISISETNAILYRDKNYQSLLKDVAAQKSTIKYLNEQIGLGDLDGFSWTGEELANLSEKLNQANANLTNAKLRAEAWKRAVFQQHGEAEKTGGNGCGPASSDLQFIATQIAMSVGGVKARFTPACQTHDVAFASYGFSKTKANNNLILSWQSTLILMGVPGVTQNEIIKWLTASSAIIAFSDSAYTSAQRKATDRVRTIYQTILNNNGIPY
jgi:RHS repeat-associated protein